MARVRSFPDSNMQVEIRIQPEITGQKILGFGGSFTQASAAVLQELSAENRKKVLEAYFGDNGSRYSLTRTHINSCDFSTYNYCYAPVSGDKNLESFSIEEDKKHLIPLIKDAAKVSINGFKIIASPWTAPPWMKDNNDWRGGKLLPEYQKTWAQYFSKYIEAYQSEGIDISAITVNNEPLGNDENWESMHFTPEEMNHFVLNALGPELREKHPEVSILGYDQNRDDELLEWADAMYDNPEALSFFDGTAVHWYGSTFYAFPEHLRYVSEKAPEKLLIQTEACIDAEVPRWQDDAWYWTDEAKDWGYTWAPENKKHLHPKYAPVFRYANDIIDCLNNGVHGWIDWNLILNRQGGPNWAKNWCIAPIIADTDKDEIYLTPLYFVIQHFSKFIRPDAIQIQTKFSNVDGLNAVSVQNPDGSIVLVLSNKGDRNKKIILHLNDAEMSFCIRARAVQTVLISRTLEIQ